MYRSMAPNEDHNQERGVVADLTDPERLYENRDKYPEMMEDIKDEFGEVTVETCERALEEVAEAFAQIRTSD